MPSGDRPHRRSYAAGEKLFGPGDSGKTAFIIESGQVELHQADGDNPRHVATLHNGDVVGEMALIDDGPRTVTAIATEATEVFVIDREHLRQQLGSADPTIRLLMRALLDRLRTAQPQPPDRIARELPRPNAQTRDYGVGERRAIGLFKFEHELKRGLSNGEFELTLQPIVRLDDRQITGFEALMVWRHPTRGRLPPNNFIAIAERSGLVRKLDDLALRSALRALNDIQQERGPEQAKLNVSVNLSGVHVDDAKTVERVQQAIEDEGFDPNFLSLEITESWLVSDPDRAQGILTGLKDLGLSLALDDFGTGYSSLGYLHRFPIDYLKVDRSFTRDMQTSAGSANIVRAVIGLAHTFGLQAIAEGIDNADQIAMLRGMSCEYGQGYHFSPPLSVADAHRLLASNDR